MRAGSSTRQKGAVPVPEKEITAVVHCLRTWRQSLDRLPVYIGNLKEKIPQLIVQLAEASRELELERKKKELADETVRRDEMIKSASRLATRIKNAVERKKEQELFLRIAESKASRLTEVFHSLVSQLRE